MTRTVESIPGGGSIQGVWASLALLRTPRSAAVVAAGASCNRCACLPGWLARLQGGERHTLPVALVALPSYTSCCSCKAFACGLWHRVVFFT